MNDTTKNLPNSYHQGYCYFDVNTGKFWIDTTDTSAGRMAINAAHADSADAATLAAAAVNDDDGNEIKTTYVPFGTSFTPSGSISVTLNTTTVNSITDVGSLPSLSMDVTNEVLSFSWATGTLPTKGANTTVATGVNTASFTGTSITL